MARPVDELAAKYPALFLATRECYAFVNAPEHAYSSAVDCGFARAAIYWHTASEPTMRGWITAFQRGVEDILRPLQD